MAYRSKKTSSRKSRSSTSRYASRKPSTRTAAKRRTTSARPRAQTIRIVVESPSAQSSGMSEGFSMPANQNAPRKAVF